MNRPSTSIPLPWVKLAPPLSTTEAAATESAHKTASQISPLATSTTEKNHHQTVAKNNNASYIPKLAPLLPTPPPQSEQQQQDNKKDMFVTPQIHDVLIGRGSAVNSHPGNVQYRTWVENKKAEYQSPCTPKHEKKYIALFVVAQVRSLSPPGRFLQQDPSSKRWFEVQDSAIIHEKVSRALRENRTSPASSSALPTNNSPSIQDSNQSSVLNSDLKQIGENVASMPTVASASAAAAKAPVTTSKLPLSVLSSIAAVKPGRTNSSISIAATKKIETITRTTATNIMMQNKSSGSSTNGQGDDQITMNRILSTTKELQMYHDAEFCDFVTATGHQLDKYDDAQFANYVMAIDYCYNAATMQEKQLNDDETFNNSQQHHHPQDSLRTVDYTDTCFADAFDGDFSSPAA